jgi:competence protein ComFC
MKKINKLIDFFFPVYCLNCQKPGQWLCFKCASKIKISKNACFICNKFEKTGKICPFCRYKQGELAKPCLFDSFIYISSYQEKSLKKLIIALKYSGVKEIANILAKILNQKIKETWPKQKNILIPIPIQKNRKKIRGYNQTELIAQALVKNNNYLKIDNNLIIEKKGMHQTGRRIKDRFKKQNQLIWLGSSLSNKNIIIIDDVVTTGATLNSAALALKRAGAKNIKAATILKA